MLLDLQQRALRQKQVAVDAGGKLADVAGAQQQLVAGDFGFGRVLAQRGNEELAPEHRGFLPITMWGSVDQPHAAAT